MYCAAPGQKPWSWTEASRTMNQNKPFFKKKKLIISGICHSYRKLTNTKGFKEVRELAK
jgi:hypothetical protein